MLLGHFCKLRIFINYLVKSVVEFDKNQINVLLDNQARPVYWRKLEEEFNLLKVIKISNFLFL